MAKDTEITIVALLSNLTAIFKGNGWLNKWQLFQIHTDHFNDITKIFEKEKTVQEGYVSDTLTYLGKWFS